MTSEHLAVPGPRWPCPALPPGEARLLSLAFLELRAFSRAAAQTTQGEGPAGGLEVFWSRPVQASSLPDVGRFPALFQIVACVPGRPSV